MRNRKMFLFVAAIGGISVVAMLTFGIESAVAFASVMLFGATLTEDSPRDYALGTWNSTPVVASDIIYEGAAVGDNGSGYARPLVAGDPFLGFNRARADNSSGSAGDINADLNEAGKIQLAISGLAITDVGKDVYASDDATFTLTSSSNSRIGYVLRWIESGKGIIKFEAVNGIEAELTDSTTGTANDTVTDVGGAFSQATLNNNFADLIAKINYLLRRLGQ